MNRCDLEKSRPAGLAADVVAGPTKSHTTHEQIVPRGTSAEYVHKSLRNSQEEPQSPAVTDIPLRHRRPVSGYCTMIEKL